MKKNDLLLIAMLAAGTATFLFAVLRKRRPAPVALYARPKGGEKKGEFELFIGS